MELLTVYETAQQLEVSKQTIYKKLEEIPELKEYIVIQDKIKYLKPEALPIIQDSLKSRTTGARQDNYVEDLKRMYEARIQDLQDQVNYLKQESTKKNELIETNQELLKNLQVIINNVNNKQLVANIEKNRKWYKFWT